MEHGVLVYKVNNPVQSSLLSSLVFNSNTRFFYLDMVYTSLSKI